MHGKVDTLVMQGNEAEEWVVGVRSSHAKQVFSQNSDFSSHTSYLGTERKTGLHLPQILSRRLQLAHHFQPSSILVLLLVSVLLLEIRNAMQYLYYHTTLSPTLSTSATQTL